MTGSDRGDRVRIDGTGTIHAVGRKASQDLRARTGEWRLEPGTPDALLLRRDASDPTVLRMAGEIRVPGALCDVVATIAQSAWGGELAVVGRDAARSLFFDGGNVVGAATDVEKERIGETLYKFGVVTRSQLKEILESARRSGKRLGEAAIELEFVTTDELYAMMTRQVEEVFYSALQVSDATYFFFDRFDEKRLVRRHNLSAGALLMEGARRMDEMRFFREKIPSDGTIPAPAPSTVAAGKKPPADLAHVFEQCDGKRTVADIGRRVGQLEFEVTRAVFQLVSGGFVTMIAPRPHGAEAIVEVFNPALLLIHKRCDAAGKGVELRSGLEHFSSGTGVYVPLFQGAGPRADGSFQPERIAKNLAVLAGDDPDTWLTQQLYDYTGFALFQASSLLSRDEEATLNVQVAELVKPMRQAESASPASRRF